MRNKWMVRLKSIGALLLSIAMIVSFSGCGKETNNAQNENEYDTQSNPTTTNPDATVGADFERVTDNTEGNETFADVIEQVQNRIQYNSYSDFQKEYCRGDFFEIDGKNALVLMYHILNGTELTPGYYVGL